MSAYTFREFAPDRIPGLLQWYAADQETGLADGAHDTSIPDRSGNGHTLTGATGPQWRDAANGIGGVPAYEFGGGREVSAASRVLPLDDFTLFLVTTNGGGRPFGLENDGDGDHGLGLFNNQQWIIRRNGGGFDITTASISPAVHALRIGDGVAEGHANQEGEARADLGAGGYSDAGVNFTLGSSGNGGADLTGKIAECITYSRFLTNREYGELLGFLRDKYGV